MPSATHQDYVAFFRNHPKVALELARRAGAPFTRKYRRFEMVDAEYDNPLKPGTTVRADLAIVGQVGGKPHRGLIFEVQLGRDADKEWSTVLYRAGLRYRIRRAVWSVIFSPDAGVRRAMSRRGFVDEPELRPYVVKPTMIPRIRDLSAALADYPWAVLSAVMHRTGPGAADRACVAIQALVRVAPREYERYIQLVSASVGRTIMQQVRERLPLRDREELSELERQGGSFNLGLDEGLAQGLEQMRESLYEVLQARGLVVDDATRRSITACSDFDELRDLLVRAATISTADGLFPAP